MIQTIIKKGSYQDSVVLMLLSSQISAMDSVERVSIMMATPANKDILAAAGFDTPELRAASANDMAVMIEADDPGVGEEVLRATDEFLKNQGAKKGAAKEAVVDSWEKAVERLPQANLAVISLPGTYAAAEADRALDEGLNVFIFSDNVSVADELALKGKAHRLGLLVMGPDCGTGIIGGVPIAFANAVRRGEIGVVGASGTGIQEVTSTIHRLGAGVSHAIGTGGRDLKDAIGGITMLDAIDFLEADGGTKVIVVISKPPGKAVRDKVVQRLRTCAKPVVSLFLGEKPEIHETGFYHAYTLAETAQLAVAALQGEQPQSEVEQRLPSSGFTAAEGKTIKGYYSGGTLAAEAALMIADSLDLPATMKQTPGSMLDSKGQVIIDLGDDAYTQGKPHPMIDPENRLRLMAEGLTDATTGVILFDVVLGYGSHRDMATALVPGIESLSKKAAAEGRDIYFVAAICGTDEDPQGDAKQRKILADAGVLVYESNKAATAATLALIGTLYREAPRAMQQRKLPTATEIDVPQGQARLQAGVKAINLGLESFAQVLQEKGGEAVQFAWTPPAGGDMELIDMLRYLRSVRLAS